jgi:maltose alpha-D-glucosyltransferase/alpha-amylase
MGDYVILDFEGEPARSLIERRRKQSPLRDLAGMLRSFHYAAYTGLYNFTQRRPEDAKILEPWTRLWHNAVSNEFLRAYKAALISSESPATNLLPPLPQAQIMLDAYLLEKALYEVLYELNNRPAWIRVPLSGIFAILD